MGIFGGNFGGVGGLGGVLGGAVRKVAFAAWEGTRSPYGLPIPIVYGVAWVAPLQIYAGEQILAINYGGGSDEPFMLVPVYTVDGATGAVSIEEQKEVCQSAVLVLCESATTILDILKNGVSINTGMLDDTPITTVTQRLRMISGRVKSPDGVIPPTGEEHGYFWPGLPGTATAHTRFSRTANLGPAPYTYSTVARCDFCALGIGKVGARHSLRFKVQGELAASATVGSHPADVLLDLWERAGKNPAHLDVESYYRAYVTGGGGSGSTGWRVNRTIDSQTSARSLMQALLDETFSTTIKKEDGTLIVVPRDVAVGGATSLGVNDFVRGSGPIISVEMRQASDKWNCFPVIYEVTTESGSHQVTNEDTTYAVAHPFSATETIRRAPPVSATWVSTAEHALNLSFLLARENCEVRSTYKFRLHKRWVLLQEGDLLSLTEPHLGISAKVVKITRTSEGANGVIEIEATEWTGQVAYTTPAVDPFDGFGGTLPGNPKDPNTDAIDAMLSDGVLAPVEKPNFLSISRQLYGNLFDKYAWFWEHLPDGYSVTPPLYTPAEMFAFLLSDNVGFDVLWFDIPALPSGDQAAAQAALDAWMVATTPIVDPVTFQAEFQGSLTSVAEWEAYALTYVSSGPGVMNALGKTGVTAVTGTPGATTFLRGDGSWAEASAGSAYDLAHYTRDRPGNSEVIARWTVAHSLSFAANFAGSQVSAGIAASGETPLDVRLNGTSVGTLTFPASGTVAAMSCTAWTCVAGDVVTVIGPAGADATLAVIAITLVATRTA